jgi:hypothetical protein
MTVGVTPKLTASDKLSSSAPILEVALSILALNPSTRSKKAASKTQTTADFHSDSSANLIPVRPTHIPTVVNMLGIKRTIKNSSL